MSSEDSDGPDVMESGAALRREEKGAVRAAQSRKFSFKVADLVLVKWNDGMVYFAKIRKIDWQRKKCVVVFDDKSQDECHFAQIHSVDETTTDIICIKCKKDDSESPNEIVLCDTCGIGYHQKCHMPPIPSSALELDTPWNCIYCLKGSKCPYLTESLDVLQNLLSDDEQSRDVDQESVMTTESDQFDEVGEEAPPTRASLLRKRKGKRYGMRRERRRAAANVSKTPSPEKHPNRSIAATVESADSWQYSTEKPQSPASDSTKELEFHSPGSRDMMMDVSTRKRKRGLIGSTHLKRQKRSSVESHTVSVTRISVPVCEDSTTLSPSREQSCDSSIQSDTETPLMETALVPIKEEETKPRSLRVSLSLPDDTEGLASPVVNRSTGNNEITSKTMASTKSLIMTSATTPVLAGSPVATPALSLPSWDDIPVATSSAVSVSKVVSKGSVTVTPTSSQVVSQRKDHKILSGETVLQEKKNSNHGVGEPTLAVDIDTDITPLLPRAPLQSSVKRALSTITPSPPLSSAKRAALGTTPSPPLSTARKDVPVVTPSSSLPMAKAKGSTPGTTPSPPLSSDDVFESPPLSQKEPSPKHLLQPSQKEPASSVQLIQPAGGKMTVSRVVPTAPSQVLHPPSHDKSAMSKLSVVKVTGDVEKAETVQPSHAFEQPLVATPLPKLSSGEPTTAKSLAAAVVSQTIAPAKTLPASVVSSEVSQRERPTTLRPQLKPPIVTSTPRPSSGMSVVRAPIIQQAKQKNSPTPLETTRKQLPTPSSCRSSAPTPRAATVNSVSGLPSDTKTSVVGGQKSVITPVATTSHRLKETTTPASRPAARDREADDVIITSVNQKKQLHTPSADRIAIPSPSTGTGGAVQGHYVRSALQDARTNRKIIAKTVEIQQAATPPNRPIVHPGPTTPSNSQPLAQTGAGSIVHPIASQTPVTVMPMVVTPTAYTPASGGGAATAYFLPALPNQPHGQQVYAVPALPQGGQTPVQYIITSQSQSTDSNGHIPVGANATSSVSPVLAHVPVVASGSSVAPPPPPSATIVYSAGTPQEAKAANQQGGEVAPTSTIQAPAKVSKPARPPPPYKPRPCAVVSALPTPSEGGGGALYISDQAIPGLGTQSPHYVAVSTPVSDSSVVQPLPSKLISPEEVISKSAIAYRKKIRKRLSEDATKHLQEITKKIESAFSNCSEDMLIAAFDEAWSKFQANGKKYKVLEEQLQSKQVAKLSNGTAHPAVHPPPNAEVISAPGATQKVSLIRSTGRTSGQRLQTPPTPTAPISSPVQLPSQQVATTKAISFAKLPQPHHQAQAQPQAQPQPPSGSGQQQYIYAYSPHSSNQQIFIQPGSDYAIYTIAPPPAQQQPNVQQQQQQQQQQMQQYRQQQQQPQKKAAHVQTAGLYYPQPQAADSLKKREVVTTPHSQQPIILAQPSVHGNAKQSVLSRPAGQPTTATVLASLKSQRAVNPRRRSSSNRVCALCSKDATYLCSGCHLVWYCGRDCQLKAWEDHADHCKA